MINTIQFVTLNPIKYHEYDEKYKHLKAETKLAKEYM